MAYRTKLHNFLRVSIVAFLASMGLLTSCGQPSPQGDSDNRQNVQENEQNNDQDDDDQDSNPQRQDNNNDSDDDDNNNNDGN